MMTSIPKSIDSACAVQSPPLLIKSDKGEIKPAHYFTQGTQF